MNILHCMHVLLFLGALLSIVLQVEMFSCKFFIFLSVLFDVVVLILCPMFFVLHFCLENCVDCLLFLLLCWYIELTLSLLFFILFYCLGLAFSLSIASVWAGYAFFFPVRTVDFFGCKYIYVCVVLL